MIKNLYFKKIKKSNLYLSGQESALFDLLNKHLNKKERLKILKNALDNTRKEGSDNIRELEQFERIIDKKKDIVWIVLDEEDNKHKKAMKYFMNRYKLYFKFYNESYTEINFGKLKLIKPKFLWYFLVVPKYVDHPIDFIKRLDLFKKVTKENVVDKIVVIIGKGEEELKAYTMSMYGLLVRFEPLNLRVTDFVLYYGFANETFNKRGNERAMRKFENFIFK